MKLTALALSLGLFGLAAFAQSNRVPLINQPLVPASVQPGSPTFRLTVNGNGFAPSAVVRVNGKALRTKFVSRESLEASVPAKAVVKPGTLSVTVLNPGAPASNVVYLTVRTSSSKVVMQPDRSSSAVGWAVVGDFNGDGRLDIAVANKSTSTVDVYLGKGEGKFAAPIQNPAPASPGQLLVGDFNGDGKLDVAVTGFSKTCSSTDTTSVMLGSGDGTLTLLPSSTLCDAVEGTADFNGDGKLDLILTGTNGETSETMVYLGNGDGTFNPNGLGNFGYFDGATVAIGDFNGDGKLDLAFPAANGEAYVSVWLGNGDGTFKTGVSYSTLFASFSAIAADVNGDGKLDIVTGGVSVLLGNGDGTFTSDGGMFAGNGEGTFLTVGDFNGDGKLDMVVNDVSNDLFILLGNGDGTFQSPLSLSTLGGQLFGLVTGDFNDDGKLDLVGGYIFFQQ